MCSDKCVQPKTKKAYVKPELLTHGSVAQLTQGGCKHEDSDYGSGIKLPCSLHHGHKCWGW